MTTAITYLSQPKQVDCNILNDKYISLNTETYMGTYTPVSPDPAGPPISRTETPEVSIQTFLTNATKSNYNIMVDIVNKWLNSQKNLVVPVAGLRVVVVFADGTVALDTNVNTVDSTVKKLVTAPGNNTFDNIGKAYIDNGKLKYSINENHSTRSSVMNVLVKPNPIFFLTKHSNSSNALTTYLAARAGPTINYPWGVTLVSMDASV
jgi:hypothetical protein